MFLDKPHGCRLLRGAVAEDVLPLLAADLSCCLDAGELNSRYSCLVAQPKAHHSATLTGNTPALQRRSM